MINPTKYLLLTVGALIITLLISISTCNSYRTKAGNAEAKYEYLHQSIDSLKDVQGRIIAIQDVAITQNEADIKAMSDVIFDLKQKDAKRVKEVESLVRVIQQMHLDTVYVPFNVHDTTQVRDTGTLKVPMDFKDSTKDYDISGTIYKSGMDIHLIVPDTVSTRIIVQKQGLFKKPKEVLQIIHSNSFVKTIGANSMVLQHKTSAWNRWLKPLLAAVAAGFIEYKLRK